MKEFIGTGSLIRLILRRDRFILPVWIILLAIMPIATVSAFKELYPTAESRQVFEQIANASPALLALLGELYSSKLGALVAWRASIIGVFVAIASLLTVIRHTRTEEEAGRRELLGSTVVGRYAPLSAALIVIIGANLVFAAILAVGLISQGLDATGSVAIGLSYAAPGWVFAAIAAISAQLTKNAGSARGIASAALGLSFVARAVGSTTGYDLLSWLSPLGWAMFLRPFAGESWWVLWLPSGTAIMFSCVAYVLLSNRDIGSGLLAERLGRPVASIFMRGPLGLAWRLQRNLLLAWLTGLAIYSFFMGAIIQSIQDMLEDNPQMADYFATIGGEAGLTDITISVFAGIIGLGITVYAIQAVFKLQGEEINFRADPVLATAVGRFKWAASHLLFAFIGPALAMAVTGFIIGLTYGVITDNVSQEVVRVLGAMIVQLPAVWVLVGLAVSLYGLKPRFTFVPWALLVSFFFFNMLGEILKIPEWILDISPFNHLPKLPTDEFVLEPIIWLLAIAVALTITGLAGFRRRDISRT